ncbi:MAG TPA: hypothetical protein VJN01_15545, partial [Xanthomonadales bacterium]|nr:hypothetical protein [Xanthomonadales bacterium]
MARRNKTQLPIDDRPLDTRLPIKLDSTSNGEFMPIALTPYERQANQLALEQATAAARRTGQNRRTFLASSCGAAATLLAFNQAHAFATGAAPAFDLPADAAFDPELAASKLQGAEFIFDIQGHYLPPDLARTLKPQCKAEHDMLSPEYMGCMGADDFIKDVFLDSDTDLMALSFIPSTRADEPISIEEAAKTREMVDQLGSSQRLLLHGRCNPNQPGDLELMD